MPTISTRLSLTKRALNGLLSVALTASMLVGLTIPSNTTIISNGGDTQIKTSLTIKRGIPKDGIITGDLYVNGRWECKTREASNFLIEPGIYRVTLYKSPKFGRLVPLVHVPGRSGIEIHPGERSTGCILVSSYAFQQLMQILAVPASIDIS